MKKYISIIVFGIMASTTSWASVEFCANGKCSTLDEKRDYPQIYTSIYGIFKNGISKNLGVCDSDANFDECLYNGIQYFGKVGVSKTNFKISSLTVVDTRINPKSRNLEVINDYYTFVNGRRVLCTAAKDVLTLKDGNVSLLANDISCPYNLQFTSNNMHDLQIKLIDLDRKIIGVEYEIEDSFGAIANPSGFAIIDFASVPTIDFNKINQDLNADYKAYQNKMYEKQMQMNAGVVLPPSGMTNHIPTQNTGYGVYGMYESNIPQQYDPMQNQMQQYAPMVQTNQTEQEFSYRSSLPYPWGYYYAPEGAPDVSKEMEEKVSPVAPTATQTTTTTTSKKYEVMPLPKNMVVYQPETRTAEDIIKEATVEVKKDAAMQIEGVMAEVKKETPVLKITNEANIPSEVSIGVFNEEAFVNSVPK